MKFPKKTKLYKALRAHMDKEDYLYLQKKIRGRSVYRGIVGAYKRIPKHRNRDLYLN